MTRESVQARIGVALDEVERREGVRILLAVESGSRAWGFASRDSDYDVRFLFVRPLPGYLAIAPPSDVIERPLQDELDLGGWDLRKALGLMMRSNAVAMEWLASPMVYRQDAGLSAALRSVAHAGAYLPALAYHYDRVARSALVRGVDGEIGLKACFYALRPVLALLWMREHASPPPMHMEALLAGVAVPDEVRRAVEALRLRKAAGTEADAVTCPPVLEAFLATALALRPPRPGTWGREEARARADTLFRKVVLDRNVGRGPGLPLTIRNKALGIGS
ncbi:MAG: nucleotidyltransferase domain-containing protein [Janthinobacterium lividum]